MVSQSQPGSRSGSPGRVLTTTALSTVSSGAQRILVNSASAQKRSKIPRSQGCSREASPSRLSVARSSRIPRPSVSQGCSREASRESSRDTSPVRSFQPLGPGYGMSQSSRLSSSVSAMRVLNTGSDVEEAVADALKNLLEDGMNHTECTQMTMPTAMLLVRVQNAPIALEMVVFLPT